MGLDLWNKAQFTDLKAWQDYYRAPVPEKTMDVQSEGEARLREALMRRYGITSDSQKTSATNEFPIAAQPQSPAADVLLALSKYDSAIEELRRASRLPCSRFPVDYSVGTFPPYTSLKAVASVLRLRAVAELNNGQIQTALADVRLILYLANSIRGEPGKWSLQNRLEIVEVAIQPLWEGLARRQWSEDQLVSLDNDLSRFDTLRDYNYAVRADLARNLKMLDSMRQGRMTNTVICCDKPMFWPTLVIRLSPSGWYYMNELAAARRSFEALSTSNELALDVLSPDISSRLASFSMSDHKPCLVPYSWPVLSFIPTPDERSAPLCARAQASVDLARVAIALERFRRANGSFPSSLDVLAPDFLQKVPHDIVTGEPLHYRQTNDGQFLLYSVGWDVKDNGGEPANSRSYLFSDANTAKGDWVWRSPQK